MEHRANESRLEWNDRPVVRVEATVMVRGDLGWSPHLGAGYSKVSIYENLIRTEYRLYAFRIQDKSTTLDTLIPCNMPFTKASAIFHHWVIGGQRMGLAFNGTADARSFDRGIRVALENLDKASAVNLSCGSSTTSEDLQSVSPSSSPPLVDNRSDDPIRPFKTSTSSQTSTSSGNPHVKPHSYHSLSTIPNQQYRPKTYSASSWQHTATSSRPMRRHSSSVPGHAYRTVPTTPVGANHSSVTESSKPPLIPPHPFVFPPLEAQPDVIKDPEKSPTPPIPDVISAPQREFTSSRRHRPRHRNDSSAHSGSRSRRTKTPNLDHLERQRDLQPTKPNSYVQIASSKNAPSYRAGSRISDEHSVKHPSTTTSQRCSNKYFLSSIKTFEDSSCESHSKRLLYQTSPTFRYCDPKSLKQSSLLSKPDYDDKGRRCGKEDLGERSRCRHCQTIFNHERNRPGSCPEAPPDTFELCIDRVSCISHASAALNRCLPDSRSDQVDDVCTCSRHMSSSARWKRWIFLGLFSVFVPCVCLYPILRCCHRCGVACHICGGRHEVNTPPKSSPSHPLPGRH